MKRRYLRIVIVLSPVFVLLGASAAHGDQQSLAIKAGRIDVGDGESIANGVVLIDAGKITAVGADVAVPDGARVIDLPDGVVTPGLIDANTTVTRAKRDIRQMYGATRALPDQRRADLTATAALGAGERRRARWQFPFVGLPEDDEGPGACPFAFDHGSGERCKCCGYPDVRRSPLAVGVLPSLSVAEQSSEVVPHICVIDAIDLRAPDFARLARRGVTTVFVSPDSASVIGARGAIVKTAGPADRRVVRRADAVKAAMGSDPSRRGGYNSLPVRTNVSFYSRRPHTRMGVTWVFRKAFHEARAVAAGLPEIGGADTPTKAAYEPLIAVLEGELPLRIQARTQTDIVTAIRLADEFGLRFILEEATEAYRCLDELKAAGVPVIYGPIFVEPQGWRTVTGEARKAKLATARSLFDRGIETALTANEMRDEDGLAAQAMHARRYGLTAQQALAAVTATPARILGIDQQVGTVASGKDADLVLWSGEPFALTSCIHTVLVNGEIVHEAK